MQLVGEGIITNEESTLSKPPKVFSWPKHHLFVKFSFVLFNTERWHRKVFTIKRKNRTIECVFDQEIFFNFQIRSSNYIKNLAAWLKIYRRCEFSSSKLYLESWKFLYLILVNTVSTIIWLKNISNLLLNKILPLTSRSSKI